MYKGIYAYAWDLADEGLEVALGRIRETGVNTITLAASYHAGKFLRPHGRSGKVYFPADGAVYFRARPERASTPVWNRESGNSSGSRLKIRSAPAYTRRNPIS